MPKVKYYFDADSVSYKQIRVSSWHKLTKGFAFVATAALFGLLFYLLSSSVIQTPEEIALRRELGFVKTQYGVLNKKMVQVEAVLDDLKARDNNLYRAYFEVSPIPDDVRKGGFGGTNRYASLAGFANSQLVESTARKLDEISKQMVIQSKSLDEIVSLAKNKEKMLASLPAIQPIAKKDLIRVSSGFGMRLHPILKVMRMHTGIDFSAKRGAPIYATGDGVVAYTKHSPSYGNEILIKHGFGYQTRYAHMLKYIVRKGQKIKRGDCIGYVGNTGISTGSHLHYEVLKNGKPVDPIHFFYKDTGPEAYKKLYQQVRENNQSLD
ncbi:MAG: M23 family metallopeptidase [Flavobacteriales bacterium]